MTQSQMTALMNLLLWVAFAAGDALLKGMTVPLMRVSARRNDPSVMAGLFAVFLGLGAAALAYVKGALPTVWALSNDVLVRLGVCGLLTALLLLSLFTALTGGLASKVAPVVNLSMIPVLVASHFLLGTQLGLWRICCILLILLGTVLMLSRMQSVRGQFWLVYAVLAMLLWAGLTLLKSVWLPERLDAAVYQLCVCAVAAVALWILAFARGKQRTMGSIRAAAWIASPLAGFAYAGSYACNYYAAQYGEMSRLAPLTLLGFASMLLFSRMIARERQPISVFFGAVLTLLGMFAILMGW